VRVLLTRYTVQAPITSWAAVLALGNTRTMLAAVAAHTWYLPIHVTVRTQVSTMVTTEYNRDWFASCSSGFLQLSSLRRGAGNGICLCVISGVKLRFSLRPLCERELVPSSRTRPSRDFHSLTSLSRSSHNKGSRLRKLIDAIRVPDLYSNAICRATEVGGRLSDTSCAFT
jgi:hypothetical protein